MAGTNITKPFEKRTLWTWDHRMDWARGTPGRISMGGGGTYHKDHAEFLADYKSLIDFLVGHGSFNSIIIWGFLRETHGGVDASKELCDYATERGIRILPGVGTSWYEGFFFEGEHRFNVSTWLKEHPDLKATNEDGSKWNVLCPSKPGNQQWLLDGCRWLFENFSIGGVNFEIGDFFVCHCEDCVKSRATIPGDFPEYYKQMILSIGPVAKLAHKLAPNAWLNSSTYTDFTPDMMANPPKWIEFIPEGLVIQWVVTSMTDNKSWPEGLKPPTPLNEGLWNRCNRSTFSYDHFFPGQIRHVCRCAHEAGFIGMESYGEFPADIPSSRLLYDAWKYFLDHPAHSLEQFAEEGLGHKC